MLQQVAMNDCLISTLEICFWLSQYYAMYLPPYPTQKICSGLRGVTQAASGACRGLQSAHQKRLRVQKAGLHHH